MTIPSAADVELEFYEHFFLSRDLEPYPVQEEAFTKIFAGESVSDHGADGHRQNDDGESRVDAGPKNGPAPRFIRRRCAR